MAIWFWVLGYALCGVVTAVWYLRRLTKSPAWMDAVDSGLGRLPPYVPRPGVLLVVGLIVLWPIPVAQYVIWGRAFRGDPDDR